MGSGAFWVEACRQLADELAKAWHHHRCVPALHPDEDEVLRTLDLFADPIERAVRGATGLRKRILDARDSLA